MHPPYLRVRVRAARNGRHRRRSHSRRTSHCPPSPSGSNRTMTGATSPSPPSPCTVASSPCSLQGWPSAVARAATRGPASRDLASAPHHPSSVRAINGREVRTGALALAERGARVGRPCSSPGWYDYGSARTVLFECVVPIRGSRSSMSRTTSGAAERCSQT